MTDQVSRHIHSWLAATSLDSLDLRQSKHTTPLDQPREKRHMLDSGFPPHAFVLDPFSTDEDDDVGSPPVELAVTQARMQDREHHSCPSSRLADLAELRRSHYGPKPWYDNDYDRGPALSAFAELQPRPPNNAAVQFAREAVKFKTASQAAS